MNTLNVNPKALRVIELVKDAVSKSITGVSFFSIKNYTNKFGEVSNYLINVGIRYDIAKQKDIEFLQNLKISEHTFKSSASLIDEARKELIAAFLKPDINRSNGQIDAYTTIFAGVKVHNDTGILYIYGHKENKTIITEGKYPVVNSRPLTIAKDELRKLLKTGKFTQFAIEVGNTLKANGETIEI